MYIYFNSGVNTSKCTDWTTTRRTGYKPETDEPIEPQYTATRDFGSKKGGKINKSESKKRSAVKTNNTDVSWTCNSASNKSKSVKSNILVLTHQWRVQPLHNC